MASVNVGWACDMRLMSSAVAEFHGDDRFGDHIRCAGTAHVDAEDFIGFGMRQHLIEPSVSMEARARPLALNGNEPDL